MWKWNRPRITPWEKTVVGLHRLACTCCSFNQNTDPSLPSFWNAWESGLLMRKVEVACEHVNNVPVGDKPAKVVVKVLERPQFSVTQCKANEWSVRQWVTKLVHYKFTSLHYSKAERRCECIEWAVVLMWSTKWRQNWSQEHKWLPMVRGPLNWKASQYIAEHISVLLMLAFPYGSRGLCSLDLYGDCWLVVRICCEGLCLLARYAWVALHDLCHDTTSCLNAKRQGCNIHQ